MSDKNHKHIVAYRNANTAIRDADMLLLSYYKEHSGVDADNPVYSRASYSELNEKHGLSKRDALVVRQVHDKKRAKQWLSNVRSLYKAMIYSAILYAVMLIESRGASLSVFEYIFGLPLALFGGMVLHLLLDVLPDNIIKEIGFTVDPADEKRASNKIRPCIKVFVITLVVLIVVIAVVIYFLERYPANNL